MEKIRFLNTYVNACTMDGCIREIERMIACGASHYVVAVNSDVIVKIEEDAYLKSISDQADMVLVDGKPLIWIAKKYKYPVTEKISGSDLVPKLCERAAEKGYTVYILGGKEGVAEQAKNCLAQKYPDIRIVGTYAPPLGFESDGVELSKINQQISEVSPDILLVCLGCPKQEKFVYENIGKYRAGVSICAGATVDFLAETVKRAPKWMSNCGLEWLYRFLKEPRRLFRRYFIDDVKIFRLAKKYGREHRKRIEE